jgi:hypothetical protein
MTGTPQFEMAAHWQRPSPLIGGDATGSPASQSASSQRGSSRRLRQPAAPEWIVCCARYFSLRTSSPFISALPGGREQYQVESTTELDGIILPGQY